MLLAKTAKKDAINLDESISVRLRKQHEEAPNTITENQLKGSRFESKDVTIEKQLEKVRTGSAEVVIEKNLNDSKGKFAPLRNDKTAKGDINKLEEKRLAGDRAEKEKYEVASGTQKKLKWWEGLKEASSKKTVKTAQSDLYEELQRNRENLSEGYDTEGAEGVGQNAAEQLEGRDVESLPIKQKLEQEEGGGEEEDDVFNAPRRLQIERSKVDPENQMLFYTLSYNPLDFRGKPKALSQAALKTVLEANPSLAGKISEADFIPRPSEKGMGILTLRKAGPEFFGEEFNEYFGGGAGEAEAGAGAGEMGAEEPTQGLFDNVTVETVDAGGTPTTVGRVSFGDAAKDMAAEDRAAFGKLLEKYVLEQKPGLQALVPEKGDLAALFDYGMLQDGEVTFAIGGVQTAADVGDEDVSIPLESETEAEGGAGTPEDAASTDLAWREYQEREKQRENRIVGDQAQFDPLHGEPRELRNQWKKHPKVNRPVPPAFASSETDFPIVTADIKKK